MGGRPATWLRVVGSEEVSDPAAHDLGEGARAVDDARDLIDRARRRDEAAWSSLYRAHYDDVYRHVLYLHGDIPSVEDLVQETFVRAMKGIRGYRGDASFSTWLRRIALNVVRRHWRRTGSHRRTIERFAVVEGDRRAASPEEHHAHESRARAMLAALEHLTPRLREAFVLRDLLGMASSDAAALLGISPGHLAVRGHRARAKLREVLVARGWAEAEEDTHGA